MAKDEFNKYKQLVEELCSDQYNNEIMLFFARHPYTRFDKQVLRVGLGLSDAHRIEMALEELSGRKLLETKNGHGVPLYWLTRHELLHSAIKSALAPKMNKMEDTPSRLSMLPPILPLIPCPEMAASTQ
jgi:hypothetical protein